MKVSSVSLGKAGEFRVASELLLRGHEIFLTVADMGVDLILGNGKRLQIKSAHMSYKNMYTFDIFQWKKRGKPAEAHPLEGVDYIICWAIDDDSFFIIPASFIRGKSSIVINPHSGETSKRTSKFMVFKNKWEVLKGGN